MTHAKQIPSARQWGSFALLAGAVVALSFVGLPSLAELTPVRLRMELNNAKQIDGGATFYTDQPFLEKLLAENENPWDSKVASTYAAVRAVETDDASTNRNSLGQSNE